jgi:siroheme decarboxylase
MPSPAEGDASGWLTPADVALLRRLHGGFPLVDRPFAAVGAELGLSEDEVIERLGSLLSHDVLTRFGPLFQIERAGGCFVLAAMAVPEAHFDEVARIVNARPEVAHNYRRESTGPLDAARRSPEGERSLIGTARRRDPLNMWFVVAAESADEAETAVRAIEAAAGLPVLRFPKEREFRVELRLPIGEAANAAA